MTDDHPLATYRAASGTFEPVWTLEIQTLPEDVDRILHVHHYEQPVVFLREDWVSRSAYDPTSDNPNRWWNNGRGLPERLSS